MVKKDIYIMVRNDLFHTPKSALKGPNVCGTRPKGTTVLNMRHGNADLISRYSTRGLSQLV